MDIPKNVVILMSGLPGTGKSTAAGKLDEVLEGYDLYSLLGVRRELGHEEYDPEQNYLVMNRLIDRTIESFQQRKGVILDSTFTRVETRQRFYSIARVHGWGTGILVLETVASEEVAKKRMSERPPSDGLVVEPSDPLAYDGVAQRREPITPGEFMGNAFISHVVYDSEHNTFSRERVYPYTMVPLVDLVEQTLTGRPPISAAS